MDFELDGGEETTAAQIPAHGKCSDCGRKTVIVEVGPRGKYCLLCHEKRFAAWNKSSISKASVKDGPPLW